jgi:hypothetical protein
LWLYITQVRFFVCLLGSVILKIELRVLYLLGKQAKPLEPLSQPLVLVCLQIGSALTLLMLVSNRDLPTFASSVAGITAMYYHAWLSNKFLREINLSHC